MTRFDPRSLWMLACAMLVGLAGGCAELRAPPSRQAVPLALISGAEDPLRGAARLSARDFADQGAALAGNPAAMARAAARLEYLTQAVTTDPRYAAIPGGVVMGLGGAVREVRAALGVAPTAIPEQLVTVLSSAADAIDAGREPAWPAALFPAGPQMTIMRMRTPGPLPEAAIATGRLEEAIASLDAASAWGAPAGALAPRR